MKQSAGKVVICGVPGSDNLGDGVIADCIAAYLHQHTRAEAVICDISYRENVVYDSVKGRNLGWFHNMPSWFRKLFVSVFFTTKFLLKGRKFLKNKMLGADLVVVGGGQLLSDIDWNFPLKLYFVTKIAESLNIPIKICAVGVASKWSPIGRYFVSKLLFSRNIQQITARDPLSLKHLQEHFGIMNAELLPDPAVMCSLLFPTVKSANKTRKKIGIGVADVAGLNYSSDKLNDLSLNSLASWTKLIHELQSDSAEIVLFTNGAMEDESYMQEVLSPYLTEKGIRFQVNPRFQSSQKLVEFLASLDSVFAFRLHANIIAGSYEIPHFAIGWDNKVQSFFSLQGRSESVFSCIDSLADAVKNEDIPLAFDSNLTPDAVKKSYSEFFKNVIEK